MAKGESSVGVRVLQVCLIALLVAGLWLALIAPSDTGMVMAFADPPRSLQFSLALWQISWPHPLIIACGAEGNIDECDFTITDDYTIVAYCHQYGGCDVNPTVKAAWEAAKAHVGDYPTGPVANNPACENGGCPSGVPPYIPVVPDGSGNWVPAGSNIVVYTTTLTTTLTSSTTVVTTTTVSTVTQTIGLASLVPTAVGVMQSWGLIGAAIGGGGLAAVSVFKPEISL